ncbi:MAG: hypothetical protein IJ678_05190 [Kiritimatiellae bacterium]|nr:hypothetical protein [Kiritimatiellia bacterium]
MNKTRKTALLLPSLLSLLSLSSIAAHVEETMTLEKGWNAIYLESTPDSPACDDFFRGAPVERVAAYHSDAYSSTRQIADDGTLIAQKPLSWYVWVPGDETASTMTALSGGRVYMVYASGTWTKTFLGVPAAPQQTWRATSGDTGFMNIAGVSADADAAVTAKTYFGEGPFGAASGVAYQIGGSNPLAPTFLPMMLGAKVKLQGGKAYALAATKDGDWPGAIGFSGTASVAFDTGDFASVTLKNFGTAERTFTVKIVASADGAERFPAGLKRGVKDEKGDESWIDVEQGAAWDVALAPDALATLKFAIDRTAMEDGATYAAVMQIGDNGGTQMRVRIPVTVAEKPEDEAPFPTGLWAGYVQMEAVSSLTNDAPAAAAGKLKMNILVHVGSDGKARLLQRVAAGVDSEGRLRLFGDLAAAKDVCENPRRLSTVMMSVDTPSVEASAAKKEFGKQLQFDWTVDADARDNPFRHAWHPDHDGLTADYSGKVASGDDLANYANPVKPELWSVTNTLSLTWSKPDTPLGEFDFEHNPDETTSGYATWQVGGLLSGGPINSLGVFYLKRIADVGEVE